MSSTSEIVNGVEFTWDKGSFGLGVYKVDGKPVTEAVWRAKKARVSKIPARKVYDKAYAAYDACMKEIYAYATCNQVFSECVKLAPIDLQTKLDRLRTALTASEINAVAQCKAYRGTFGSLIWYKA